MSDNVRTIKRSKDRMPPRWSKHVDGLRQTEEEIKALRWRLEQQRDDLIPVMSEDLVAEADLDVRKVIISTRSLHEELVRDAITLLQCASERIGVATPDDIHFELRDKTSKGKESP